jgi:proteasome lid subunit RPN8/RPN11
MVATVVLSMNQIDSLALQLVQESRGAEDEEAAAFVVREASGSLTLVPWPRDGAFRSAHWVGLIPRHTVAVIHTHPWRVPRPSNHDKEEARRLRLPFYVASRTQLCVAEANGHVRCRNWPAP